MDDLLQHLQHVHRKVTQLEKRLVDMKTEQQAAQRRIGELEGQLKAREEAYQALNQQYEAARVVRGIASEGDREALQAKIDLYLQEIDICLKSFGE